jgi:Family of unknown function (DUF6444)
MDRAEAEAIYDAGRETCVQFILDLAARVQQLEERLSRLEALSRQDSRTSSRPPSMDPPKTRAQRRAEARAKAKELMRSEGEGRKAGGQSGHRGAGRELRPEDQMDEIVDHYPDACGGCGHRFASEQRMPSRRFGRHQVCELPPISVTWTEHRTHQLRCRDCRARTSARLPEPIGACPFGPRLQAAVVTLTARHRISRRGISELTSSGTRCPRVGSLPGHSQPRGLSGSGDPVRASHCINGFVCRPVVRATCSQVAGVPSRSAAGWQIRA